MKKETLRLYVAELLEIGKGLGLVSLMEDGEAKEKAQKVLEMDADGLLKQLELTCEDASWKDNADFLGEVA